MRGKATIATSKKLTLRITPAYAGKRKIWNEWFRDEKDHPRVCGEKQIKTAFTNESEGSPPRMRGKGGRAGTAVQAHGITPAYAGKRMIGSLPSLQA